MAGRDSRPRVVARLLLVLVPRQVSIRYRENVLDVGWSLITPVATMVVYGIVLTQSFDVRGQCAPYLVTAWTGMVLWTFVATAVGVATWSLVSAGDLLGKLYFPREAIPLSVVGASMIDLGIGMVTVFALALVQGVSPRPVWVAAIAPLVLLALWVAAACLFVAALTVFVRDTAEAVQLILRVGFFATPVMYEASLLPGPLAWTAWANPIAVSITAMRDILLCGTQPDWVLLVVHTAIAVAMVGAALGYVRSVEGRMTDAL